MAKKLGISTVAEGVETQDQWDLVRELGCELAQGYFIAKPGAASEFLPWARNQGGGDPKL
jgi:EAL domain-containing protein (putative c-di-GMP-specific phosphodiesterase class I)